MIEIKKKKGVEHSAIHDRNRNVTRASHTQLRTRALLPASVSNRATDNTARLQRNRRVASVLLAKVSLDETVQRAQARRVLAIVSSRTRRFVDDQDRVKDDLKW